MILKYFWQFKHISNIMCVCVFVLVSNYTHTSIDDISLDRKLHSKLQICFVCIWLNSLFKKRRSKISKNAVHSFSRDNESIFKMIQMLLVNFRIEFFLQLEMWLLFLISLFDKHVIIDSDSDIFFFSLLLQLFYVRYDCIGGGGDGAIVNGFVNDFETSKYFWMYAKLKWTKQKRKVLLFIARWHC